MFSVFRFPITKENLLRQWVANLPRQSFKPTQRTLICSEHFTSECFYNGRNKRLKPSAVPTVFVPKMVCIEEKL